MLVNKPVADCHHFHDCQVIIFTRWWEISSVKWGNSFSFVYICKILTDKRDARTQIYDTFHKGNRGLKFLTTPEEAWKQGRPHWGHHVSLSICLMWLLSGVQPWSWVCLCGSAGGLISYSDTTINPLPSFLFSSQPTFPPSVYHRRFSLASPLCDALQSSLSPVTFPSCCPGSSYYPQSSHSMVTDSRNRNASLSPLIDIS